MCNLGPILIEARFCFSNQPKQLFNSSNCACSSLHLEARARDELLKDGLKLRVGLVTESLLCLDCLNDVGVLALEVVEEHFLEFADFGGLDLVEEATDTSVEDANLFLSDHGHVLLLLKELGELLTSVEEMLGGSVEIGTELGEGGDLSVLGQLEFERTSDLLHSLDLGGGTDTGHRQTDVNGGTDTLIEKLSLQEDLTIGNGDHIGRNIGGHITSLGLNNGEGGEGSGTVGVVHLSCTLEKTRVEIEDVSWVGLSAGGSSQQERHLSVGDGLLGQIVIDDQAMLSVVSEVLTNSAAGIRSQELKRGGL